MNKKRVFIVHGWGGFPQEGWLPWLKKELENKGFTVEVPSMPDTDNPKIETWIPYLAKIVGDVDENTFFVGHSIGCQTILRYLEGLPTNKAVGGAIFVAGFFSTGESTLMELTIEEKEIIKPWINTSIDLEKVKSHLLKSIAIFSDNDPFVPLDNKNQFAKLGSRIIVKHQMSHFDASAGITQLPIALESILEIAES